MQPKIILITVGILAAMLLIWAFAFNEPYQIHGSEIMPSIPAPAIQLARADGTAFDLTALTGKIVLIFFGYTSCPDVCPTTMTDMMRVKAELGSRGDSVDVLLITVDPQRDTPDRIQAYVNGFDETFIGLSGTEAQLEPVWKGYGVYREITGSHHDSSYSVDHSTRIYLIDEANHLRVTYPYGTPAQDLAEDIRFLLKE